MTEKGTVDRERGHSRATVTMGELTTSCDKTLVTVSPKPLFPLTPPPKKKNHPKHKHLPRETILEKCHRVRIKIALQIHQNVAYTETKPKIIYAFYVTMVFKRGAGLARCPRLDS